MRLPVVVAASVLAAACYKAEKPVVKACGAPGFFGSAPSEGSFTILPSRVPGIEIQPAGEIDADRRRRPRLGRGVQHRRMLDRRVDQRPAGPGASRQSAQDGGMHGGRAGGQEGHLVGAYPEGLGDAAPRRLPQLLGPAAGGVQPVRVGPAVRQGGQQRLPRNRMRGSGAGRVEVGRRTGGIGPVFHPSNGIVHMISGFVGTSEIRPPVSGWRGQVE